MFLVIDIDNKYDKDAREIRVRNDIVSTVMYYLFPIRY